MCVLMKSSVGCKWPNCLHCFSFYFKFIFFRVFEIFMRKFMVSSMSYCFFFGVYWKFHTRRWLQKMYCSNTSAFLFLNSIACSSVAVAPQKNIGVTTSLFYIVVCTNSFWKGKSCILYNETNIKSLTYVHTMNWLFWFFLNSYRYVKVI